MTSTLLASSARILRVAAALSHWRNGAPGQVAMRACASTSRPWARGLKSTLLREIGRLPHRYRMPAVLCYLEGMTNEEAASQLGCSPSTVCRRLARVPRRLHAGLRLGGLAIPTPLLLATLATLRQELRAAVPSELVHETARRATLYLAGRNEQHAVSWRIAGLAEKYLNSALIRRRRPSG